MTTFLFNIDNMTRIIKRIGTVAVLAAFLPAVASAQNAEKVEALAERDPHGIIMSITAAGVVFASLLILYLIYRYVGKGFSGEFRLKKSKAAEGGMTPEAALAVAMALDMENSGETQAAIALALHQYMDGTVHDNESFIITIRHTPSAWNSRQFTLRQLPK